LRAAATQIHVDAPLDDGEQGLIRPALDGAAALRPVHGAADRFITNSRFALGGGTLIQAHGNVRTEVFLNANRLFGTELQQVAVDVRPEHGGFVGDLEVGGETIDLVAAAVGKDRPVPVHEAVQA